MLINEVERIDSKVVVIITDTEFVSSIQPSMKTVQDLMLTLVRESSSNENATMTVTTHFVEHQGFSTSDGIVLEFDTDHLGNGIGSKTIEEIADNVCILLNRLY